MKLKLIPSKTISEDLMACDESNLGQRPNVHASIRNIVVQNSVYQQLKDQPDGESLVDFIHDKHILHYDTSFIVDPSIKKLTVDDSSINIAYQLSKYWIPVFAGNVVTLLKRESSGPNTMGFYSTVKSYYHYNLTQDHKISTSLQQKRKITKKEYYYGETVISLRNTNLIPIGAFNPYNNRFTSYIKDNELVRRAILKSPIYQMLLSTVYSNKKHIIGIGIEQEHLYTDSNNQVVPAHEVIMNRLDTDYGINKNVKRNFIQPGSRRLFNDLFTTSFVGTDGRRMIAEFRGNPFLMNIMSPKDVAHKLRLISHELKAYYTQVRNLFPSYKILLGGGQEGESIGFQVNYSNLALDGHFIKYLNILTKKMNDMPGAQRPRRINPTDTFTTDESQRHNHNYGQLGSNSPDDLRDGEVRSKSYPARDNISAMNGFEYRPLPSFGISPVFFKHAMRLLLQLVVDTERDLPPLNRLQLTYNNFMKVFGETEDSVVLWHLMENQDLRDNPYWYWLDDNPIELMSRFRLVRGCDKKFLATPQGISKVRKNIKHYIPAKGIFIKIESNKTLEIDCHPDNFIKLKRLKEFFNYNFEITKSRPKENCFIIKGRHLQTAEFINFVKICCLACS